MGEIKIVLGDITKVKTDAIVNSANKSLLRGGGVDGVIHKAAGRELELECRELGSCPTGQARITKSYKLENQGIGWIIHAVGPRWFGGTQNEEELLENAYMSSLNLVENYDKTYLNQCESVLEKYIKGLSEEKQAKVKQEILREVEMYIEKHPIKTIAMPSISTGVYHFPIEKAAFIAVKTINKFLSVNKSIDKMEIVCFNEKIRDIYLDCLIK